MTHRIILSTWKSDFFLKNWDQWPETICILHQRICVVTACVWKIGKELLLCEDRKRMRSKMFYSQRQRKKERKREMSLLFTKTHSKEFWTVRIGSRDSKWLHPLYFYSLISFFPVFRLICFISDFIQIVYILSKKLKQTEKSSSSLLLQNGIPFIEKWFETCLQVWQIYTLANYYVLQQQIQTIDIFSMKCSTISSWIRGLLQIK